MNDLPFACRAANDRAPREKRSSAERLANAIGRAVFALYCLSLASSLAALFYKAFEAAVFFTGSAIGCGVTLTLISWFQRKLADG